MSDSEDIYPNTIVYYPNYIPRTDSMQTIEFNICNIRNQITCSRKASCNQFVKTNSNVTLNNNKHNLLNPIEMYNLTFFHFLLYAN